jgi:hypothetical protein
VLFLDDDPKRADEFLASHPCAVWVQKVDECIERLNEEWCEVHLDHDLGGEIFVDSSREDCGMEVVRWLCASARQELRRSALFVIHTHNMNAAGAMVRSLREAGYEAVFRPFGMDLESWLTEEEVDEQAEPTGPDPPPHSASLLWLRWLHRLSKRLRRSGEPENETSASSGAAQSVEGQADDR